MSIALQRHTIVRVVTAAAQLASIAVSIVTGAALVSPNRAAAAGTINGTVFQDYNANGLLDTGPSGAIDRGVGGVTVTAYDAAGSPAGSATSAPSGAYSLVASGSGPYRIEFTGLPTGFSFGSRSTDSFGGGDANSAGTAVQFVADGGASGVNLAVNIPADYCQNNPGLATCTYWIDPHEILLEDDILATRPAVRRFPATAGAASTETTVPPYDAPVSGPDTVERDVGTVYGLGYDRVKRDLYAAAYFKRFAVFGPQSFGGVYRMDATGAVIASFVVPNAGVDPHLPPLAAASGLEKTAAAQHELFDQTGKVSLGGLAISDDSAKLFVMNLNDRQLYAYDTATLAPAGVIAVPNADLPTTAGTCAADDVRPFAVEYYHGKVYVGAVCSAQSTQNVANLHAYVWRVNADTLAFEALIFNSALNYDRGYGDSPPNKPAEWQPWASSFSESQPSAFVVMPQPMLSNIAFDNNGDMILGLRDRFGDQMGNQNFHTTARFNGIAAGDTLRACAAVSGWVLENAGVCPSGAGAGLTPAVHTDGVALYPQGPGGGEFYFGESWYDNDRHDETSAGGVLQIPGYVSVATTNYNPITEKVTDVPGSKEAFDVGVRWMSNSTGQLNRGYRLVDGNIGDTSFAYANGIGELVALCDAAPIEIGNRVWEDLNKNGIQDPAERGLEGVLVELFAQDAGGGYTIPAGSMLSEIDGDYRFGGLAPNTPYRLRIALANNFLLAPADAGSGANADAIDSDAFLLANDAVIDLRTGVAGENNHTFDIGLTRRLGVGNLVWFDANNNGKRDAGESGVPGVTVELLDVTNTFVQSTTTNGSGEYQFVGLLPGVYAVQIKDLPAGFVSSTGANSAYEGVNTPNPDDGIDDDDNGSTVSPGLIRSKPVELSSNAEVNDGDTDPNNNPSLDFGVLTPNLSLGDYVWLDLDKDGIQDDGEPGVNDVTVRLFADANADGVPDTAQPLAIKNTDASGKYLFTDLAPGNYVLEFAAPATFALTGKSLGGDANTDSDADPISGRSGSISLVSGSTLSIDAGLIGGSIGNFVWIDQDRDGQQDAGEPGIPGAIVTLFTQGSPVMTATTSISGAYLFRGLPSGTYSLTFKLPNGFAFTEQNIGSDDSDSDVNDAGASAPVTLTPGQDLLNVDAGAVTGVQIIKSSNRPNQSLRRGDVIIYSIDVINLGAAEIKNVTLVDPVPANTEYQAGTAAPTPVATAPLRWVFDLPANGSKRFSFAVKVATVPSGSARVSNIATLTIGSRRIDSNELVNPLQSTVVSLNHFAAERDDGGNGSGTRVVWETLVERNTLGFNVWRSLTANRLQAVKITSKPIPARGQGAGGLYQIADTLRADGAHYWLEELELSGSKNIYGPAIFAPVAAAQPETNQNQTVAQSNVQAAVVLAQPIVQVRLSDSGVPVQPVVAPVEQSQRVTAGNATRLTESLLPQPVALASDISVQSPVLAAAPNAASSVEVNALETDAAPIVAAGSAPIAHNSSGQREPLIATDQQRGAVLRGQAEPSALVPVTRVAPNDASVTAASTADAKQHVDTTLVMIALSMLIAITLALGTVLGGAALRFMRNHRQLHM